MEPFAGKLTPADVRDLAAVLVAARLPDTDLTEPGRLFFRFDADGLAGYGGLEGEGADRLLRSIVVLPDRREKGLGGALIAALERQARDLGVRRLHLLTTTAAPFFRALGYADVARTDAPQVIAVSREFTALCPATAAYLVKAI